MPPILALPIVYGTADKTASNGFIFTNYLQFYYPMFPLLLP